MKILNFGSLNIDKVYHVESFVRPGETISSTELDTFCGGKGLNQSIAIARAGAEVYHAGCIGCDGDILFDALTSNHVHTDYLKKLPTPTGHAIIQVERSGQNCIILFGGANQEVSAEQVDDTLSHFSEGDILLLQNEINNLAYIIDQAYQKGMVIILNPSPVTGQLSEISLEKISYLILNEIEAADLCQEERDTSASYAELLYEMYPSLHILLTMGTEGSLFVSKEIRHYQKAYQVSAIDTTAAGDTFTGYFIAAIARGSDVKTAMKEASKASSIAVTRAGASASIPFREEVSVD